MSPLDHEAISNRLIEIALPEGGVLVTLVELYIDESASEVNEPLVLTCAGYAFKSDHARKFTRDARKDLDRLGLSHFHQTDCANGEGEYKGWPVEKRLLAQKLLRENIKRRTFRGVATSINVRDYISIVGSGRFIPTPYAYALTGCLNAMRRWIEQNGYKGRVAYFFEDGHAHRADAESFISNVILKDDESKQFYRSVGAGFYDKRSVLPLQAADMLAWFAAQEFTRYKRGIQARRKDFEALLRPEIDVHIMHTPQSLRQFRDILVQYGAYKESGVAPPASTIE